uniref:G-protein coupled receptors family 1 profile domain-containing protein n=1 Tax=Panagrolaimus sp. ES5 TaxID=591445 RepID=A0AC34FJD5_9BILA
MSALGLSEGSEVAMEQAVDEYWTEECQYIGTDYLHIKIYLIGVFGTAIALLNIIFNSFFTLVFVTNKQLRLSPLYYFGILAILDILLAINYILLMSVPVYMDQFEQLWLYHIFLTYVVPMMTASNCAMFGSMLLIFMATLERLLRTFHSEKLAVLRKFWWMFVARNLIDRIFPFFILVLINFLIIRTLKREQQRFCVNEHRLLSISDVSNKKILRDATRALIALVSLYLMSQTLQVFTTFWEAFHRSSLEGDYSELYSYLNDIMSLMTLLSSTLRFPVYCSCNKEINEASKAMLIHLKTLCSDAKSRSAEYLPISIKNPHIKSSDIKSSNNKNDSGPNTSIINDQNNVLSITEDSTTWML